MSHPREERSQLNGRDSSYVGTPSFQRPPLARPRLEVAANAWLGGSGDSARSSEDEDEDSTAGYVCRASRPLHANANARLWHHDGCPMGERVVVVKESGCRGLGDAGQGQSCNGRFHAYSFN